MTPSKWSKFFTTYTVAMRSCGCGTKNSTDLNFFRLAYSPEQSRGRTMAATGGLIKSSQLTKRPNFSSSIPPEQRSCRAGREFGWGAYIQVGTYVQGASKKLRIGRGIRTVSRLCVPKNFASFCTACFRSGFGLSFQSKQALMTRHRLHRADGSHSYW